MICYVTAIYAIRDGYESELRKRFSELLTLLPIHSAIFVWADKAWNIEDSRIHWLLKPLNSFQTFSELVSAKGAKLPESRNLGKDTLEYIALMNTKVEMIWRAIPYMTSEMDTICWIDAGITKIFTNFQEIRKKLESLQTFDFSKKEKILMPGCWKLNQIPISTDAVYWRFCGGFFIVPKVAIDQFQKECKTKLSELVLKNQITWEVNVWAMIEQLCSELFEWYSADHNDTIIPNICVLTS
jgi:hypothetical protein